MPKILAIDDKNDNLIGLKAILSDLFKDVLVITALSGHEGLTLAASEQPDVILCDVVMPVMDGFEVCKRLKADSILCDIPVIFITALQETKANRYEALKIGAEAFLSKPIDETELTAQIRAMLKISTANELKRNEKERLAKLVSERTLELEQSQIETLKLLADLKVENEARKQTEQLLVKNKNRLDYALKSIQVGAFEMDLNSMNSWRSFQHDKILGYDLPIEQMNYDRFLEHVIPEDRVEVNSTFHNALKTKTDWEFECRIKRKNDGKVRNIWVSVKLELNEQHIPIRMFGVVQDITVRKNREKALIESEERFELAMTATQDGLYDWNLITKEIYYSQGWKRMLGYKNEELPNDFSVWENLVEPKDLKRSREMQEELVNKQRDRFELEIKMKHKDGHLIDILSRSEAIFDQNGKAIRIVGTHVDISERKLMENELINSKEKAEESDRLKSAFLANMSHEIRTPMNGIMGFAELLKRPNLSGEDQKKFIGIIQNSGDRMLNIINDIVDISKIESGLMMVSLKESNINDQIEYIYNFFKPEVEKKGVQFRYYNSLASIESYINTDSEKVYAILTNLVKNAIKFTSSGSLEFGYIKKGNYLEFYVKDTGIGIPKDRQKAIFERFIQADIEDDNAYQGAGLGLSISAAYVKMLGGEIWVSSEVGKGSCFYFTLPFLTEVVKGNKINKEIKIADEVSDIIDLKILIAEDDEASEALMSIYVEEFSNEIINVGTGTEAVSKCVEYPDIDIVLMDILMPKMDGFEATRKIREFNKDIIIIAQSAYGLEGDKEKAIAAGCNDFIAKPIKATALKQIILKNIIENN